MYHRVKCSTLFWPWATQMALLNTRETHPKSVVAPACFRAEFSLICAKCRRESLENKGELGHAVHLANDKWRGNQP